MKLIINTVAFIAFVAQFFSFAFTALNLKKPASTSESLYNDFVLTAYICSLLSVAVFVIQYNFSFKFLRKKTVNIISLGIVALGGYIHFSQLFVLHDFIISSCILLLFDYYIIRKILCFLFRGR
jgi:hypothetical protein